jgi:hypothetical protein
MRVFAILSPILFLTCGGVVGTPVVLTPEGCPVGQRRGQHNVGLLGRDIDDVQCSCRSAALHGCGLQPERPRHQGHSLHLPVGLL